MDRKNEFREIIDRLSEHEKKSLMDSNPEEVAKRWGKMYKVPIEQSNFFLNNLFFKRSFTDNDTDSTKK